MAASSSSSTAATDPLDAGWAAELLPALRAIDALYHGDASLVATMPRRTRMRWNAYLNELVKRDRRDVERMDDHLCRELDDYVARNLLRPLEAIVGRQFHESTDAPVLVTELSTNARVNAARLVAREYAVLRRWAAWQRPVFNYLDRTLTQYTNARRATVEAKLVSRVSERVYDGLYPVLLSALFDSLAARRIARRAAVELAADSATLNEEDISGLCALVVTADVRRPDAQRRRGLEEAEAEARARREALSARTVHGDIVIDDVPTALKHHVLAPLQRQLAAELASTLDGIAAGAAPLTQRLAQLDEALDGSRETLALFLTPAAAMANATTTFVSTGVAGADLPPAAAPPLLEDAIDELLNVTVRPMGRQLLVGIGAAGSAAAASAGDEAEAPTVKELVAAFAAQDRPTIARFGRLLGRAPHVADGATSLLAVALKRTVAARLRDVRDAAAEEARNAAQGFIAARKAATVAFVEGATDVFSSFLSATTTIDEVRVLPALASAVRSGAETQLRDCAVPVPGAPSPIDPADLFARYCDLAIRRVEGTRLAGAADDDELAAGLKKVAAVATHAANQDQLSFVYRELIAERLLSGRPPDTEVTVLGVLRPELPELRDAELLLRDFLATKDEQESEKEKGGDSLGSDSLASKLDFSVTVVAQGRWPSYATVLFNPPPAVATHMQLHDGRWHMRRRALQWHVKAGKATAAIFLPGGTREVVGGLLAVSVLYHIDRDAVTLQELQRRIDVRPAHRRHPARHGAANEEDASKVTDASSSTASSSAKLPAMLREAIVSLGTIPRLVCVNGEPAAAPQALAAALEDGAAGSATLSINTAFTARQRRLEIRAVQRKEKVASAEELAAAKQLEARRRVATEACVMRVMKSRKVALTRDLLEEVQRVIARTFDCPPRVIRDAITTLIEKEYLERVEDEGAGPAVRYLA